MRFPAPVLVLLALAVLATGGVFALFGADEADLPTSGTAVDASAAPDETGLADGALATAAAGPDLDADPTQLAREMVSEDAEEQEEELPEELGTTVTVVRKDGAGKWQPAADVEVAWIEIQEGRRGAELLPPPRQIRDCELPFRLGPKSRTGSDGTLRLPPTKEPRFVAAREPGQFAFAGQRRPGDAVRLELRADETLTVLVLQDGDRRVARAPVALLQTRGKDGLETFFHGETDRKGELVLAHFQLLRPQHHDQERFFAGVAAPLQQQVTTEFEGRPAPTEPVRLLLPATRPIHAHVVHRNGAPLLARIGLQFVPVRPKSNEPPAPTAGRWDRLRGEKPLGREPLVLPHAGPGLDLQPLVQLPNEDEPRRLPIVRVPTEGSGPLDVVITLPDDVRVVAVRAVTGDGDPLGSASLPWQLQRPIAIGHSGELETLPDGTGDFVVPREGNDPSVAAEALTLVLRETIDRETVLGGQRPLGALLRGERRDLGTVVMTPLPVLVRGRAIDDLGQPRTGQTVRVELAPLAAQNQWPVLPNVRGPVGEDGTFTIHAPTPQRPFRVVLGETNEHFPVRSDLLSPGAFVELVQPRAGRLLGLVTPPAGLADGALTVSLAREFVAPEEAARARPRNAPVRRGNTRFFVDKLEPGSYQLTLTMRGLAAPLATFPGVLIGPGENRDPRMQPIDLATALHAFDLRAVSTNGLPLADLDGPILWRHRTPTGETGYTAFRWQKGKARFWLPVPYAELVFVGAGIPATELAVTAGTRDVALSPITPFPVELPGVRALAGPERAIRVSAVFVGETGLPDGIGGQDQVRGEGFSFPRNQMGKSGGGWLDGADRTGLVVSRPGQYQLTLRLYATAAREGRQSAVELGTFPVVVDGSAVRPLVLAVDQTALQRALASLQPQPDAQNGARPSREGVRRR